MSPEQTEAFEESIATLPVMGVVAQLLDECEGGVQASRDTLERLREAFDEWAGPLPVK